MEKARDTPRVALLKEAAQIVSVDRNSIYGNPEDNFTQIANLWNAYWGTRGGSLFNSADVALMSALVKVARLAVNPMHHDSAVDVAGYAACLADIQQLGEMQQKPK